MGTKKDINNNTEQKKKVSRIVSIGTILSTVFTIIEYFNTASTHGLMD